MLPVHGASRRPIALAVAAAELVVVFGLIGLITGPLWGRKAWGVWWQWDARLTSALVLWLIFVAYLLLRRFGGPGSERLAAAVALFGMANVPFVYWSVNLWRTRASEDHRRDRRLPPSMREPLWWCVGRVPRCCSCCCWWRATRLERRRARARGAVIWRSRIERWT